MPTPEITLKSQVNNKTLLYSYTEYLNCALGTFHWNAHLSQNHASHLKAMPL